MGSGHSVLSPSSAKRWLTCTPSARLEQGFEDTTSDAAEEGTAAHLLAEIALNKLFFDKVIGVSVDEQALLDKYECEDMHDYVADYVDFVQEQYNSIKFRDPNVTIYLESKVDISMYVPDAAGTRDVCIVGAGLVKMIDLKYGKGVKVSAIDNEQLKLYALGTIEELSVVYDFEFLEMFIYQPRMDNISSMRIAVGDLINWASEYVIPRAKIAFTGEGEFVPGSHCQFCKVKTCAARAEYELAVVKDEFAEVALLTPAEVVEILKREKGITSWLKGLSEYALDSALKGTEYPGMKLVEGKSNRVVKNEAKLVETLVANGVAEDKLYKPKALQGITELEKVAGKKVFALAAVYLDKPEGKPTLVDESDKREAWTPGKGDFDAALSELENSAVEIHTIDVSKDTNVPAAIVHRTPPQTWQRPKDEVLFGEGVMTNPANVTYGRKDEVIEPQKPTLIQVPDGVLESPFAVLKTLYKIQEDGPKGKPKAMLVNGEDIGDLGYEGYEFFIASPNEPTQYLVFEKQSGKAISNSFDTKKEAIDHASTTLMLYFEDFEAKVAEEAKVLAKLKAK